MWKLYLHLLKHTHTQVWVKNACTCCIWHSVTGLTELVLSNQCLSGQSLCPFLSAGWGRLWEGSSEEGPIGGLCDVSSKSNWYKLSKSTFYKIAFRTAVAKCLTVSKNN